jgi:hypothetical protein
MTNQQMYFEYLDDLRESGVTNMWGAAEYLEDAFSLSRNDARDILFNWINSHHQQQGATQ